MRMTGAAALVAAGCVGLALGLGVAPLLRTAVVTVEAQAPAPPAPPPKPPEVLTPRVFKAPVGLLFSPIKRKQSARFDAILLRLRQALVQSPDPEVRRQAAGWRFFKAAEAGPGDSVLYVCLMDPTVPGADYTLSKLLKQAFPDDDQLLKEYSESFAGGQTLLNLEPLAAAPAAHP